MSRRQPFGRFCSAMIKEQCGTRIQGLNDFRECCVSENLVPAFDERTPGFDPNIKLNDFPLMIDPLKKRMSFNLIDNVRIVEP